MKEFLNEYKDVLLFLLIIFSLSALWSYRVHRHLSKPKKKTSGKELNNTSKRYRYAIEYEQLDRDFIYRVNAKNKDHALEKFYKFKKSWGIAKDEVTITNISRKELGDNTIEKK